MGKIITIVNQKGGVRKTTTSVNLTVSLRVLEEKVLLVDADPQANTTSDLDINVDSIEYGTYELLEHTMDAKDIIIYTSSPNLDSIATHISLVAIEIELVGKQEREYMLKKVSASIYDQYDYTLIDRAPSLGPITLNVLAAANSVIVPIQCEYLVLEGLGKLLNTIKNVQRSFNLDLDIEGLLLTMYNARLRLSNQVVEGVQKHFNNMVFKTIIQRNVRPGEAPSFGETIINCDTTNRGAVSRINLAQEIIDENKTA